jgi:hypothetical protein
MPEGSEWAEPRWKPGFVDYLFVAFKTSVAFSPTDTPVLSRWAKMVMMIQASGVSERHRHPGGASDQPVVKSGLAS